MDKNLKLCVTLNDEVKTKLRYFFDARRYEELRNCFHNRNNRVRICDIITIFSDDCNETS